jgi:hypothetical protein
MTDLFISYNSHDEVWAKRLFVDLRARFPTIKPFWARDAAAIPAGEPFRPIFEGAAKNATNFVVFWSAAAQGSIEVLSEVQAFLQNRDTHPKSATGDQRKLFYISLETGFDYPTLAGLQGFPDFRGVYKANDPDRGIAGLAADPASESWKRMIRGIGDAVLEGQASQPITLALFVMTRANMHHIDHFLDTPPLDGPTLNEFLQSVDLTLEQAKDRYGDTPFSWRPFGAGPTIIELMEDVRETANQSLGADYRFHWVPDDFVASHRKAGNAGGRTAIRDLVEMLSAGPSVVITDPISLFNPIVKNAFLYLDEYAKKQQSVILSMSPKEQRFAEGLYRSLKENSRPILKPYLEPPLIPLSDAFALCGMNIQHAVDAERLIRSGLGRYYLQKRKAASQPLVSGV